MIIIITYILTFIGIFATVFCGLALISKAVLKKTEIAANRKSFIPSGSKTPSQNIKAVDHLLSAYERGTLTKNEEKCVLGVLNTLLNKEFREFDSYDEWLRTAPKETRLLVSKALAKWGDERKMEYLAANGIEYTTERLKTYLGSE